MHPIFTMNPFATVLCNGGILIHIIIEGLG